MDENSTDKEENFKLPENNDKIENLAQQISSLQLEKKKIEEEFGVQRAKMKELFLQKENEFKQQLVDQQSLKAEIKKLQSELDECRSQLTAVSLDYQGKLDSETRKYQDELSTLQHLLNESVEDSIKYENENKQLRNKLSSTSISGADMPQILAMPSAVIGTLARKVTKQLGSSDSSNTNTNLANATLSHFSDSDSLEDSMRKAQEDAAVLRSLVVPLEEEIKALKDKLREMDAEVRKYQNSGMSISGDNGNGNVVVEKIIDLDDDTSDSSPFLKPLRSQNVPFSDLANSNEASHNRKSNFNSSEDNVKESLLDSSPVSKPPCEMCSNYEAQLLNAQQKIHDLEKHIVSLERYKQELSKETAFRKDMEEKWNEKKEEYKEQVSTLQSKITKGEEILQELKSSFSSTFNEITQQLKRLRVDREHIQRELNRLQQENDNLVGKHSKHSQQLQNEVINLPNNVEDLHEFILQMQEELISAKIAKETAEECAATLTEEISILREHAQLEEHDRIEMEKRLSENAKKLINEIQLIKEQSNHHKESYEGVDRDNVMLREEIKNVLSKVDKLNSSKKHFEDVINELKLRVASLQTELDNSEKVQKDFVRLSQSLQQELETIRAAESEVRWEHKEDVPECRRCKNSFSVTKKKNHCKHCGRVFCSSCLTHVVNSGPSNRPSQVCDVCHTLLVRDSAPYFSTAPPQFDW